MIDPGLQNKVVLVNGGNDPFGIGTALAKAFASHGAYVFIHLSFVYLKILGYLITAVFGKELAIVLSRIGI